MSAAEGFSPSKDRAGALWEFDDFEKFSSENGFFSL
jgi:hypothetical protein